MSASSNPFLDRVTIHRELREQLRVAFDAAHDTAEMWSSYRLVQR